MPGEPGTQDGGYGILFFSVDTETTIAVFINYDVCETMR